MIKKFHDVLNFFRSLGEIFRGKMSRRTVDEIKKVLDKDVLNVVLGSIHKVDLTAIIPDF